MALLLITHDLALARERAGRILVMYAGPADGVAGRASTCSTHPRHPYTAVLRDSEPPSRSPRRAAARGPGSVPRPWEVPAGCSFAARCPRADDQCRTDEPPARKVMSTQVACWHPLGAGRSSASVGPGGSGDPVMPGASGRGEQCQQAVLESAPPALDDVSISIGAGEAVGIVGESGSGKTTLARCLVGLETHDSGAIDWSSDLPQARRAQIVFQDPTSALNPAMTIGAALPRRFEPADARRSDVPELLDMIGLPAVVRRRKPKGLSGGEQQRVAIARALAPRTATAHLRRGRLSARRLGAGADPQPARRTARPAAGSRCSSSPTTSPSFARWRPASTSCETGRWSTPETPSRSSPTPATPTLSRCWLRYPAAEIRYPSVQEPHDA